MKITLSTSMVVVSIQQEFVSKNDINSFIERFLREMPMFDDSRFEVVKVYSDNRPTVGIVNDFVYVRTINSNKYFMLSYHNMPEVSSGFYSCDESNIENVEYINPRILDRVKKITDLE